jgi:hypothetical protein
MSRAERHPAHRHWKATALRRNAMGNLGTLAEREAEEKAAAGSASLAAAILLTVGCETPEERAPLSFEQQLALVEAGRAASPPCLASRRGLTKAESVARLRWWRNAHDGGNRWLGLRRHV